MGQKLTQSNVYWIECQEEGSQEWQFLKRYTRELVWVMLATSMRGYGEHGKGGNTEFNLFGTIEGQLSFISIRAGKTGTRHDPFTTRDPFKLDPDTTRLC
jgi:hypothetical protein